MSVGRRRHTGRISYNIGTRQRSVVFTLAENQEEKNKTKYLIVFLDKPYAFVGRVYKGFLKNPLLVCDCSAYK